MLIQGPQIWHWLVRECERCQARAWIASAYVKASRLEKVCRRLSGHEIDKRLLVRWQLSDLLSSASDYSVYEIAKEYGWRVYIDLSLHAKAYILDETGAIGSANLTEMGMIGATPPGNREILTTLDRTSGIVNWYKEVLKNAREVDDALYLLIKDRVDELSVSNPAEGMPSPSYGPSLQQELETNVDNGLLTKDMFWTQDISELFQCEEGVGNKEDCQHDRALLGLDQRAKREEIGRKFVGTKAFRWLLNTVTDEAYFGQLSNALHSALRDDPRPYRKDVKMLLDNLLKWTTAYGGEFFRVDKPNVSQRIIRL